MSEKLKGSSYTTTPNQLPNPSDPTGSAYGKVPVPEHFSTGAWQMSFYDPTSQDPISDFVKLPSGAINPVTGRLTGEGFHAGTGGHHWEQV